MSSEQSVDADMAASDEHLEEILEDLESCESPAFDFGASFDEHFSKTLDVEKLFQGDLKESIPECLACGVYTSGTASEVQMYTLVNPSRADVCQAEVCQDKQDKLDNQPGGLQTHAWDLLSASSSSIGHDDDFCICPSRQCRAGRLPPIRHPSRPDLRLRPAGCTPRRQCRSRMSRRRQLLMVTPGEAGARVAGEQRPCQLLGPFPELCCHQEPLAASSTGSDRSSMPSNLRGCAYQRSRGVA